MGLVEAQQQGEQGGLSCTGGTHQRHHLAGLDAQVELLQHRLARLIGKAHIAQIQGSLERGHGPGIGAIRLFHRLALDLAQTAERGLTLLELIEVIDQPGDRIDQDQQRRNEAAEAGTAQATGTDPQGTDQKDGQDPSGFDEAHHWVLQRQQPHGAVAGTAVLLDLLFKALLQPRLSGKRAHERQARDGLAQ